MFKIQRYASKKYVTVAESKSFDDAALKLSRLQNEPGTYRIQNGKRTVVKRKYA